MRTARYLYDSNCVVNIVKIISTKNQETLDQQFVLKAMGMDVDGVATQVAELLELKVEQVWQPGKFKQQVIARSLLCYWAVRASGITMTLMANRLHSSTAAVSKVVDTQSCL